MLKLVNKNGNEEEQESFFHIEEFMDTHGHLVKRFTDVNNGEVTYLGCAMATRAFKTPQGIATEPISFQFPIEANNISQAFVSFEERAKAFIESQQNKQQSSIIQVPGNVLDKLPMGHA